MSDLLLYLVIFFPIVIPFIFKIIWNDKISWKEMSIQLGICILLVLIVWYSGRHPNSSDIELLNASVTDKQAITKQCPKGWHSSPDSFCSENVTRLVKVGESCSDIGDATVCTPIYVTEYKSVFDWERRWLVFSSLRNFEIARVDRQGMKEPSKWTEIEIGDGVAVQHAYSNWIKASASTLFKDSKALIDKYKDIMPEYPIEIYDYFRVDRVLSIGVDIDTKEWSKSLSKVLGILGPERQMNAVLVVTNILEDDFIYALRAYWHGFKKNDAIIYLGVEDGQILKSSVLSWSKNELFNITLRDKLLDLQDLDNDKVMNAILDAGRQYYERRPMEEFEYLKDDIPTPTWVIVLCLILGIVGSSAIGYIFHRYEIG